MVNMVDMVHHQSANQQSTDHQSTINQPSIDYQPLNFMVNVARWTAEAPFGFAHDEFGVDPNAPRQTTGEEGGSWGAAGGEHVVILQGDACGGSDAWLVGGCGPWVMLGGWCVGGGWWGGCLVHGWWMKKSIEIAAPKLGQVFLCHDPNSRIAGIPS